MIKFDIVVADQKCHFASDVLFEWILKWLSVK